jgi:putative PIN family toxin of toxin-antitoxin system
MKVILDTNVFISAIFWGGLPQRIMEEWKLGRFELVLSKAILDEYIEISDRLASRYPEVDASPVLEFVARNASFVEAPRFESQVCEDPDDDAFLEAADASGAKIIVSGDKRLLACDGYRGINVMKTRAFVEQYL